MQFPESKPVEIIPYQSRWVDEFQQQATVLKKALGDTALRIDHIGSTAVPDLAAKDIIDIQITIRNLNNAGEFCARMLEAGFRDRGGIKFDEFVGETVSQSQELKQQELKKRYFREAEGNRRTHIHVRQNGFFNQQYALLFRDYLRAEHGVRICYQTLKYRLAGLFPNQIEGYLHIKDPLMDIIFVGAQSWAKTVNWQQDNHYC